MFCWRFAQRACGLGAGCILFYLLPAIVPGQHCQPQRSQINQRQHRELQPFAPQHEQGQRQGDEQPKSQQVNGQVKLIDDRKELGMQKKLESDALVFDVESFQPL